MFYKACPMQKYSHNRKFIYNSSIHFCVHSNILQNSAQQAPTPRLFSKNFVSGVPKQVENAVRNCRKFLPSFCTATVHCSSKHSISSESIEGSKIKLRYSSFSSSERPFHKIKPNYNFKPVRWYSGKEVEISLSEEINQFGSSPDETWDAHISSEPHGGFSKRRTFSQATDTAEDHFEPEAERVNDGKENRSDLYNKKPSWFIEYDGEKLLPSSETNFENKSSLSRMINNARTVSEILEVYGENQNELKFLHYDLIVRRLTALTDRLPFKTIQYHPVMVKLLGQLSRDCNSYNPAMLITLLKYLSTTRMPSNSGIVRTVLQVLRKQFNNLELKQLLYVNILLKPMWQDPVGSALKMAVPLALEYRYRNEPLPSNLNPFHLIHGLAICVNSDTADSMALAEKFMMALYEHEQGLKDLSPTLTVTLVSGLMRMFLRWQKTQDQPTHELLDDDELDVASEKESPEVQAAQQLQLAREVLFKEALQYFATNINKLSHTEVEKVLSWLSYSYRHTDACAYNQPLLRAFARRAIDQDWSLRSLAGGVMWMLKMNEVDESLLQALLKKIHITSPQELQDTELFVMPLVHALAASSTLASRSEDERHALLARLLHHSSANQYHENGVKLPVTRLGFDLACLGYFDPDVHRKILDYSVADIGKSEPATVPMRIKHHLLTLWQAHQLLNTKHVKLQVDDALLAACKQSVIGEHHNSSGKMARRTKVRKVLQQALSSYGPNSVITAVHTRHGVCVDHVIVVRGESEVVPQPSVADGRVCLDDLQVPENARVLGVLQIGPNLLLNNYTKLRPQLRLHLQLLVAEGVTVVPFLMPQYALHYRTDEEKMRYVSAALGQHRLYL